MDIIVASGNAGKIREYRDILAPLGYQVYSCREKGVDPDVEETGTTFEENALIKARAVHEKLRTAVIADDSGLEVTALGGEPGLYSARYKGLKTEHERRMAVLEGLCGVSDRSARFVCCICHIDENGRASTFTGVWNGVIAAEEDGTNGFGYDPIFISEDSAGRTTASLPITFKEKYSHRAKAVRMLTEFLRGKD
ncbi:MAG: RdgB/HAM1 family non-canonical purine NTP pyrophosphatase [Clostridia bacterium]|nr:RdgB/HAM1 family non-canonical purine NTP pyrophosphatase [Clostridia bacterium]